MVGIPSAAPVRLRRLAAVVTTALLLGGAGAFALLHVGAAGRGDAAAAAFGLDGSAQGAVVLITVDGKPRCNGVLIAPDAVLTARHCVERRRKLQVGIGADPKQREHRRVARVELHPTLDAALLLLRDEAPDFSQPAELASSLNDLATPAARLLAGTAGGEVLGPRFLEARVQSLGDEVIVNYPAGGLCKGESGAPLFAREASGAVSLVGILRGGAGVCTGPDSFIRADRLAPWLGARRDALQTESKQRESTESDHEEG